RIRFCRRGAACLSRQRELKLDRQRGGGRKSECEGQESSHSRGTLSWARPRPVGSGNSRKRIPGMAFHVSSINRSECCALRGEPGLQPWIARNHGRIITALRLRQSQL